MAVTRLSSQEFNQNAGRAREAARMGPVFITEHGQPAHVLLSIEEYQRITGHQASISDWLAMPDGEDVEFEVPRLRGELYHPADFS
jgi:prevent-host-death family protein